MNEFYKQLIENAEVKRASDKEREKRKSSLLEIRDERTIPKLRMPFKKRRRKRKSKKWA